MKNSWRSFVLAAMASLPVVLAGAGEQARAAQLVLFEGSWCPTCRYWNKTIAPSYAAHATGRKAPLRRIDVTAPRPADLAKPKVGTIIGVPTFVVVDDGREIGRIEGFTSERHFWKRLDEILASVKAP